MIPESEPRLLYEENAWTTQEDPNTAKGSHLRISATVKPPILLATYFIPIVTAPYGARASSELHYQ